MKKISFITIIILLMNFNIISIGTHSIPYKHLNSPPVISKYRDGLIITFHNPEIASSKSYILLVDPHNPNLKIISPFHQASITQLTDRDVLCEYHANPETGDFIYKEQTIYHEPKNYELPVHTPNDTTTQQPQSTDNYSPSSQQTFDEAHKNYDAPHEPSQSSLNDNYTQPQSSPTITFPNNIQSGNSSYPEEHSGFYGTLQSPMGGISYGNKISLSNHPRQSAYSRELEFLQQTINEATKNKLKTMSEDDFKNYFISNGMSEGEILGNCTLYVYPNFRTFAQKLPSYNNFITGFSARIKNDPNFRKETFYVEGVKNKGLFNKKSGFHTFINAEAWRINDTHDLQNEVSTSSDRLIALAKTREQKGECFDYASQTKKLSIKNDPYAHIFKNTYGTELDLQLHKELCKTRHKLTEIERVVQSYFPQVNIIGQRLHEYAAIAKTYPYLAGSFRIADFCDLAVKVLEPGMDIIRGAHIKKDGALCNNAHILKDIVKDTASFVQDTIAFLTRYGLNNESSGFLQKHSHQGKIDSHYEAYRAFDPVNVDKFNRSMSEHYQHLASLSWDNKAFAMCASQMGTHMIVDNLTLHTIGFSRPTSPLFHQQLVKGVEAGHLMTQEYTAVVALTSKLVIEEGTDVALNVMEKAIDAGFNDIPQLCENIQNELQLLREQEQLHLQQSLQVQQIPIVEQIVEVSEAQSSMQIVETNLSNDFFPRNHDLQRTYEELINTAQKFSNNHESRFLDLKPHQNHSNMIKTFIPIAVPQQTIEILNNSVDYQTVANEFGKVAETVLENIRLCELDFLPQVEDQLCQSLNIINNPSSDVEFVFHATVLDHILTDMQEQTQSIIEGKPTLLERTPKLFVLAITEFVMRTIQQPKNLADLGLTLGGLVGKGIKITVDSALHPISTAQDIFSVTGDTCNYVVETARSTADAALTIYRFTPEEHTQFLNDCLDNIAEKYIVIESHITAENIIILGAQLASDYASGIAFARTWAYLDTLSVVNKTKNTIRHTISQATSNVRDAASKVKNAIDTQLAGNPLASTPEGLLFHAKDAEKATETVIKAVSLEKTVVEEGVVTATKAATEGIKDVGGKAQDIKNTTGFATEAASLEKNIVEEAAEAATSTIESAKNAGLTKIEKLSVTAQPKIPNVPVKSLEELISHVYKFIKNLPDDFLHMMEKAGGHTLERHVAKTFEELFARFLHRKAPMAATTFTNEATALRVIKEVFNDKAEVITSWLTSLETELVIEASHSYPIGMGLVKGNKNPFYGLTNSKLVLRKDNLSDLGFKLLTAYPTIKL